MILRTIDKHDFNTEKLWAIECGFRVDTGIYWINYRKYTSQRRMLQAFKSLKDDIGWMYRTIHVDYTTLLENLDEKSLREYKLKQLLDKK